MKSQTAPNKFVVDELVPIRWNLLSEVQREQLNDAFERGNTAKTNLDKYVNNDTPPAIIKDKRDRRLWHKMTAKSRERALLSIVRLTMMGVNVAGVLTDETPSNN